ncbi:MAG: sensor histidine kinase [Actinomycetota bacterium]
MTIATTKMMPMTWTSRATKTDDPPPQTIQSESPPVRHKGRFERSREWIASIRVRLLLRYVLLLGLALLGALFVAREVLLARMEERIDDALTQEVEEFRRFTRGINPTTGEPYGGQLKRIFRDFLRSDIPQRGETALTFVDGEPFLRSRPEVPYRLDRDPELVARWSDLERPDRGSVDTPAGVVDYVVVPVTGSGATAGTYVAAVFRDVEKREVDQVVQAAAGIGLVALIIGSSLAWRVAQRVLVRVSAVTTTAQSISETDLTKRIPVDGRDEISRLGATFNEMLDRLDWAFTAQRSFVDDAGHELRTPITIITGHLQVLDDDDAVQRQAALSVIKDELGRMTRMVEDLLMLAKAERPDFLRFELLDAEVLTRELHSKMTALGARDWQLEGLGRGTIEGDRQRLTQAIMQLAENAVQHAPESESILFGSRTSEGNIAFWIRDFGRGIQPQDRERIFARFARGPGPRRSEGSGLGLSIVTAIVEAHHGRLHLDSDSGKGTTFTIEMPVDQPHAERTPL